MTEWAAGPADGAARPAREIPLEHPGPGMIRKEAEFFDRRTEQCDHRRSDGGGQVHQAGVAAYGAASCLEQCCAAAHVENAGRTGRLVSACGGYLEGDRLL